MQMKYLGKAPYKLDPDKFFEFFVEKIDVPLPELCQIVVERPGQEKPYLSVDGWQAYAVRNLANSRVDRDSTYALRLSNMLLKYFELGYNYKLTIFSSNGIEIGFFAVSWDPDPILSNPPIKIVSVPPFEPQVIPTEPEPISRIETGLIEPSLQREPKIKEPEPKNIPRQVIQCKKCRGEIFSTFRACPYCGLAVVQ